MTSKLQKNFRVTAQKMKTENNIELKLKDTINAESQTECEYRSFRDPNLKNYFKENQLARKNLKKLKDKLTYEKSAQCKRFRQSLFNFFKEESKGTNQTIQKKKNLLKKGNKIELQKNSITFRNLNSKKRSNNSYMVLRKSGKRRQQFLLKLLEEKRKQKLPGKYFEQDLIKTIKTNEGPKILCQQVQESLEQIKILTKINEEQTKKLQDKKTTRFFISSSKNGWYNPEVSRFFVRQRLGHKEFNSYLQALRNRILKKINEEQTEKFSDQKTIMFHLSSSKNHSYNLEVSKIFPRQRLDHKEFNSYLSVLRNRIFTKNNIK